MAVVREDLTIGSPLKKILWFSLPLMFSNLLQVLFNMSDVAIVGRFGSKEALGSVGSTSIYVILFTGILIGIGSGINALAARYLGAKDDERVARISHTGLWISLIIGFFLLLIGIALARPILVLLSTKPELLENAVLYVSIVFLGLPALAIYNYGNGILSADGDTKRSFAFFGFFRSYKYHSQFNICYFFEMVCSWCCLSKYYFSVFICNNDYTYFVSF